MASQNNRVSFSLRTMLAAASIIALALGIGVNQNIWQALRYATCGALLGASFPAIFGDRVDVMLGALYGLAAGIVLWSMLPIVE
jgi:uncharacterized membrane protein YccC